MSLLARTAFRSAVWSAPRRARFYSDDVAPIVAEATPEWRAQQEALKHHAHGNVHSRYCQQFFVTNHDTIHTDATELWRRIRFVYVFKYH